MAAQREDTTPLPPTGANKWEVLRELGTARTVFGLSDRDVSVLQALASFHPATILGGNAEDLVVHPSNKAICDRLNGMPCSTMRRHLGHLVASGLVRRKDSPNGKRYARRYGDEKVAFGFDLAPLVRRFGEICAAAEAVRAAEQRHARLRTSVSLMRRDLAGLAAFGAELHPGLGLWDQCHDVAALTARALRRKVTWDELVAFEAELGRLLDAARDRIDGVSSEDMSTSDAPSGQHEQNSNKDRHESEPCLENNGAAAARETSEGPPTVAEAPDEAADRHLPNIPLGLVLATCSEFRSYTERPVRHWHELVQVAETLRPMMGISPSAWDEAVAAMGPEEAAVVVVAMLERFSEIQSPGGYLRALSGKAATGAFSCGPMVMALMRRAAA